MRKEKENIVQLKQSESCNNKRSPVWTYLWFCRGVIFILVIGFEMWACFLSVFSGIPRKRYTCFNGSMIFWIEPVDFFWWLVMEDAEEWDISLRLSRLCSDFHLTSDRVRREQRRVENHKTKCEWVTVLAVYLWEGPAVVTAQQELSGCKHED